MKIVYVTFLDASKSNDGAMVHVLGLSSALADAGHEVHLVTSDSSKDSNRVLGIDLSRHLAVTILTAARIERAVAKRALSVIARVKPDIVYLRTFPMDYLLF